MPDLEDRLLRAQSALEVREIVSRADKRAAFDYLAEMVDEAAGDVGHPGTWWVGVIRYHDGAILLVQDWQGFITIRAVDHDVADDHLAAARAFEEA